MKKSVIILLALFGSANAASGLSAKESQKLESVTQCAYIANLAYKNPNILKNARVLFEMSITDFKSAQAKLNSKPYTPSAEELAIDYANYYQWTVAETSDDMLAAIKQKGLSPSPDTWEQIAEHFYRSNNCQLVAGT